MRLKTEHVNFSRFPDRYSNQEIGKSSSGVGSPSLRDYGRDSLPIHRPGREQQSRFPFVRGRRKLVREQVVVREILDYLHRRGVAAWRQNQGARSGRRADGRKFFVRFCEAPGISDIIGILPGGCFLAVEVKRPGNPLTDDQQRFLEAIQRAGGVGIVARSLEDVISVLDAESENQVMPAFGPKLRILPFILQAPEPRGVMPEGKDGTEGSSAASPGSRGTEKEMT